MKKLGFLMILLMVFMVLPVMADGTPFMEINFGVDNFDADSVIVEFDNGPTEKNVVAIIKKENFNSWNDFYESKGNSVWVELGQLYWADTLKLIPEYTGVEKVNEYMDLSYFVENSKVRVTIIKDGVGEELPWVAYTSGGQGEMYRTTINYKMTGPNMASYGEWFEGRPTYIKAVSKDGVDNYRENDVQYYTARTTAPFSTATAETVPAVAPSLEKPVATVNVTSSAIKVVEPTKPIKITIEGVNLAMDVTPKLVNNSTVVPARAIFEALGYTVKYDDKTQKIGAYIEIDGGEFMAYSMTVGSTTLQVMSFESSGVPESLTMPIAPIIHQGRTMVPLRAFVEALGQTVIWDSAANTISITTEIGGYGG